MHESDVWLKYMCLFYDSSCVPQIKKIDPNIEENNVIDHTQLRICLKRVKNQTPTTIKPFMKNYHQNIYYERLQIAVGRDAMAIRDFSN